MSRFVKILAAVALAVAPLAAVTSPAQASDRTWSSVDTGNFHTCAIRTSSQALYCWGQNSSGEIGDGSLTTRTSPRHIGSSSWSLVAAGYRRTCGIRTSHTLYCWGDNSDGGLGTGNTQTHRSPARIGTSHWRSVAVGGTHQCAIRTSHTLYCWGSDNRGELGDNTTTVLTTTAPQQVGNHADWDAVSVGDESTCGIRLGRLYCWGFNNVGQLGVGDQTNRDAPVQVGTHTGWTQISNGENTTCGVRNRHEYCWGENADGEVGNNTNGAGTSPVTPQRVGASHDSWTATGVGTYHSCGIGRSHALYCWGYGGDGQLGNGSTPSRDTPRRESLGHTDWTGVASGDRYTCALRSNHALYCWGDNAYGQLGLGSTTNHDSPKHVV